ncbi:unnamed protein product [Symbiodinium necroappetens]|uniref:Uncharacterized protein n=1 Tax=Symbiodinium necroappetens TaxID=1628268 RepID=A0A812YHD9_9DINO|nr:unnamed protein product [Symbiodinium necroappetens]
MPASVLSRFMSTEALPHAHILRRSQHLLDPTCSCTAASANRRPAKMAHMATPALSTVALCACLLTIVAGMEMDWTSYSDRADLPMSQKWREDMKDKLSSVDTAKLTPEQKRKFKELWRRVSGEPQPAGESVPLVGVAAVALLLGAGAYMWLTKPKPDIVTGECVDLR